MRRHSHRFHLASWLAILVMALNALWPLIANARPAEAPSLMEICTAQGLQGLPGESQPQDPAARHLQPHCPLCSFGTDKLAAVPPSVLAVAAADLPQSLLPVLQQAAPRAVPQRSPAHPRAPPVLL